MNFINNSDKNNKNSEDTGERGKRRAEYPHRFRFTITIGFVIIALVLSIASSATITTPSSISNVPVLAPQSASATFADKAGGGDGGKPEEQGKQQLPIEEESEEQEEQGKQQLPIEEKQLPPTTSAPTDTPTTQANQTKIDTPTTQANQTKILSIPTSPPSNETLTSKGAVFACQARDCGDYNKRLTSSDKPQVIFTIPGGGIFSIPVNDIGGDDLGVIGSPQSAVNVNVNIDYKDLRDDFLYGVCVAAAAAGWLAGGGTVDTIPWEEIREECRKDTSWVLDEKPETQPAP